MKACVAALAALIAVGVSVPAYADQLPANTMFIKVLNSSSKTIYVNGGSGTWDWVESGPIWNQTPIAPGRDVMGTLSWKKEVGITRGGSAGYAISLVNTGKPPNIANFTLTNIANTLHIKPYAPFEKTYTPPSCKTGQVRIVMFSSTACASVDVPFSAAIATLEGKSAAGRVVSRMAEDRMTFVIEYLDK